MKKYIISILLFIIAGSGSAQNLEKEIEKRKVELNNNGIDTLILYHVNCGNSLLNLKTDNDTSSVKRTYILFWVKNGIYYKQKIDNCKTQKEEKISHSSFITTTLNNISTIEKAEILPVEHYKKDPKGRIERDETLILTTDHTCTTIFEFNFGKVMFTKHIRQFELETKMLYRNIMNDNYNYNQKNILAIIKNLVEKET